jgi:hypothetical protein
MNVEEIKAKLQIIRNGDMGLAETFWVYFFSITVVLVFISGFLGPLGSMLAILSVGWTIFMVMPVFKAANQYQGMLVWALLAKAAMIIFATIAVISVLMNVFGIVGSL